MNSILSPSSLLSLPSLFHKSIPCQHSWSHNRCFFGVSPIGHSSLSLQSSSTLHTLHGPISAVAPSEEEGAVSVLDFEEFGEKDWSFLDMDDIKATEISREKTDRIISAGKVGEASVVLASIASEGFVDRFVETCPCKKLLVVHDSLFVLACVKEKYDEVDCWQGELVCVPEKWIPLDVVFLYFLPALPYELSQIFGALAKVCSPGARIVISHPKGREVLEQQKRQHPDVIVSDLPDEMTLQSIIADHSFEMVEFVDEPGFYIAVLTYQPVVG